MPQHRSAKKRLRQSKEQRLRNRGLRTRLRKAVKSAREDVSGLPGAISAADTAARKGILHTNKAARLKSRLMKKHQAASS